MNGVQLDSWQALKTGMASTGKVMLKSLLKPTNLVIAGVTAMIVVLHKTNEAVEEVRERADELSNTFNNNKSDIESYKDKIEDLYKTINNSGSSLEEVTTARQTLMAVQDELIDKFGDEKETIDLVTQAIYGQSSALDELIQKQWQETKNEFNESDMWNDFANWQEGYSDNIDRMVHEMENAWGNIKLSSSDYFGGEYDDIIKRLEESGWKYSSSSETFVKGGSVEDLYEEILNIQTLVGDDMPENFLKSLTDDANELKATLDNYEGMWDNYILNDKIFADDNLADSWKEVNDAYTKYQNAVTSGDKTAIEEATSGFAASINEVLNNENVSDSVKDYFKDMYPALYREVEKWEFKTNIIPEFDTSGLQGKTQADVLEMLQTEGAQDGEGTFNSIIDSAIKYGLILDDDTEEIQKILDLLVEWGILQATVNDSADDYFIPEPPKWSFTETIKQMEIAKGKLSTLDEAYAKLFDDDVNTNISTEDFNSILDSFSDIEGLDIEKHLKAIDDAGTDVSKVKSAMEGLIGDYLIYGDILNNVTAENKDLIVTMLEEIGVVNAEEIALAALNGTLEDTTLKTELLALEKQFATEKGYELVDATIEEVNQFLNEIEVADEVEMALAQMKLAKIQLNDIKINTQDDINNLIALANAAGASAEAVAKAKASLQRVENEKNKKFNNIGDLKKNDYAQVDKVNIELGYYDWETEELDPEMFMPKISPKINYDTSKNPGSATSKSIESANKSASDAAKKSTEEMKDTFQELVDFFERRAKVLNDALDLLKTNLENVNGSFAKNKLIDSQIGINAEKINNYTDAMAMYTQKANEALSKLPSDIAQKIQNGSVSLVDFIGSGNEDVVEAIDDYQNWADKVADCKQELAELKQVMEDLELQKFENIAEDFQNIFDIREDKKGTIEKQIALLKESGELIGESFYSAQIDQTKKQLNSLNEQKAKLVEQMNSALASGRVTVGSEAWLSMVDELTEVDNAIIEAKTSLEEFDNAILALHTEIFNRIQEQFSNFHSELSNMEELFADFNVSDGNGNWTDEAITRLGLLAQQYELSKHSVAQYNEEIEKLNQDYLNGRYSVTEYTDRLAELTQKQWESVQVSEEASDAIYELNKVRVEEEIATIEEAIQSYENLVNSQIEALNAEKDLHDYRKSIEQTTKSKIAIERKIIALANDDSASAKAQRAKLQAELAEINEELEEKQYENSIKTQQEALEQQFEDYEAERLAEITLLEESLKEKELLISQSFETVKQNAQMIGEEITQMADRHGIEMSNSLTSAWKSGEKAIASYGVLLTAESSNFIANLINVEAQTWQLQAQANETADRLAYMFATKADNLVAQLQASYTSEANLNQMTMALRDSLINTLERGYDISSITAGFNAIANSAKSATIAANEAANSIKNLGNTKVNSNNNNNNKTNTPRTRSSELSYSFMAKGGIISKKDRGTFDPIAQAVGEDVMIAAREGEGVFTEPQTKLLQKFMGHLENSKPWTVVDAMKNYNKNGNYYPYADTTKSLSDVKGDMPQISDKNVNNNVNMNYGSLITVNGDVNDTKHFLGQMENICVAVVNKSWQDATRNMKYGF